MVVFLQKKKLECNLKFNYENKKKLIADLEKVVNMTFY